MATWQSTPLYLFWAPQGRYVNVLDPVFLAAVDPDAHAAQSEIFSGEAPDPVMLAADALDSEFIVYSPRAVAARLTDRLSADPRVEVLHRQVHTVFRIRPLQVSPFILDWRLVPSGESLPVSMESSIDEWLAYPRLDDSTLASLEGYVDVTRLADTNSCVALVHDLISSVPRTGALEFAASGPSTVWLDDSVILQDLGSDGAVLGRGSVLQFEMSDERKRLTILTCPGAGGSEGGFYLLQRGVA